jgi:hypothetical protein
MPLQNRVTPFGDIVALPARGLFMGNRGGRIHDGAQRLVRRRWASRCWICCRLHFKDRHRRVWGDGYTELFFLDEPTALAAGHRPCFECRRAEAVAFAQAWADGAANRPRAAEMDRVLHAERLAEPAGCLHVTETGLLPDGAMVAFVDAPDQPFAVRGDRLLLWTPAGYAESRRHERSTLCRVLTPPHTLAVLAAGYLPQWHPSADLQSMSR